MRTRWGHHAFGNGKLAVGEQLDRQAHQQGVVRRAQIRRPAARGSARPDRAATLRRPCCRRRGRSAAAAPPFQQANSGGLGPRWARNRHSPPPADPPGPPGAGRASRTVAPGVPPRCGRDGVLPLAGGPYSAAAGDGQSGKESRKARTRALPGAMMKSARVIALASPAARPAARHSGDTLFRRSQVAQEKTLAISQGRRSEQRDRPSRGRPASGAALPSRRPAAAAACRYNIPPASRWWPCREQRRKPRPAADQAQHEPRRPRSEDRAPAPAPPARTARRRPAAGP